MVHLSYVKDQAIIWKKKTFSHRLSANVVTKIVFKTYSSLVIFEKTKCFNPCFDSLKLSTIQVQHFAMARPIHI